MDSHGRAIPTFAYLDAINVISVTVFVAFENSTNQGTVTSQNNTLQLHAVGFQDTKAIVDSS
jgi:hypothetical protein